MKKIIVATMSLCIFMAGLNSYALEEEQGYKEESVYGILKFDGEIESLYVVNATRGLIEDYGTYKQIENLTTLDPLSVSEDRINLPSYEGVFYYQGLLENTQLPWDFDILYEVDGKKVLGDALAGVSGELSIYINVKQGMEKFFYDQFALQISLALSNELCDNIVAEGATIVEVGGNKQIAFTLLPGQGANLLITANVKDFEMDAITINGVKMAFDLEVDTSQLTEGMNALSEGIAELDSGAIELTDGLSQVSVGVTQYVDGLNTYTEGMTSFSEGGTDLSLGLADISNGLTELKTQGDPLKIGIEAFELGVLLQTDMQLTQLGLTLPSLTRENYTLILGADESLAPILIQLEQTLELTRAMTGYIDGVGQIADGTTSLALGFDQYTLGAANLAFSAVSLYEGAKELNEALVLLESGMVQYQEGTATFKDETKDMGLDTQAQINGMLQTFSGSETKLTSFVSDKNTQVASVQFFLRTGVVEIEKEEVTVEESIKVYTFWEKILKLFGLLEDSAQK